MKLQEALCSQDKVSNTYSPESFTTLHVFSFVPFRDTKKNSGCFLYSHNGRFRGDRGESWDRKTRFKGCLQNCFCHSGLIAISLRPRLKQGISFLLNVTSLIQITVLTSLSLVPWTSLKAAALNPVLSQKCLPGFQMQYLPFGEKQICTSVLQYYISKGSH